jgi:hypothetical protein
VTTAMTSRPSSTSSERPSSCFKAKVSTESQRRQHKQRDRVAAQVVALGERSYKSSQRVVRRLYRLSLVPCFRMLDEA